MIDLLNSLSSSILYEDQDLWVIDKPPGVVVNRAQTTREQTIQDWVEQQLSRKSNQSKNWQSLVPAEFNQTYGSPENIFAERQGIVHRLDKDTSGTLIIAKNPGSLVALLAQFKLRSVDKQYQCLVHGKFSVTEDTITAPIARAKSDRQKFTIDTDGRNAETRYQVVKYYPHLDTNAVVELLKQQAKSIERGFRKRAQIYQGFSLVNCWPKTGRTHQIRVHMASIKHPLVGDIKYLGRKRAGLDPVWCPRQFLHAAEIKFTQPRTGERLRIQAPLSADLTRVLALLSE